MCFRKKNLVCTPSEFHALHGPIVCAKTRALSDRCNAAALGVVCIILTSQSGHRARHILDGALEDEDDLARIVSNREYS